MAIQALDLKAEWTHISKYDNEKEGEGATVFTLGTLSPRIIAHLQDIATSFVGSGDGDETKDVRANIMGNGLAFNVVKYGVRGITGLMDPDGKAVEFKTLKKQIAGEDVSAVTNAILRIIPLAIIRELAEEIQSKNEMTEEEAKN